MMYTPIVGTLGYVLSPDGVRVLMIHRNAREDDTHLGKYNGLGGKMHGDEDVATCMIREIREEAGLVVTAMQLRGTISWPSFGPNDEDWLGFLFLITAFEGEPPLANEEGDLSWVPLDELANLPMWDGDRHFLPMLFDGDPRPFHGWLPYEDGKALEWQCVRV